MESEFPIKEEAVSPSFEAIFDQFTNEEVENSRQNSTTSSLESNESEDLEFYLSHQNEEFYSEYKETSPTKIRESNQDLEQENYLESNLSDSQQSNVKSILDSVNALSHLEKLFLYLKLPSRQSESLIISNNKKEQTKAFKWIRENMEETDSSANIPKHEVYEKYRHDIEKRGDKLCLSAPDFGKIIKCIFPNVKARRLGTRGNSKYCYSGLRTKQGEVYEINNNRASSSSSSIEQTVSAASSLICEWAEKLLGRVFTTIIELAKFLVAGSYVSSKSMSAFVVMSASQDTVKTVNQRYSSVYAVKAPKSDKPIKLESPIKESIPPQVVPHTPKREVKTEAEECVVLNTPPPSTHKSTANIQQQQHLKQQQQQIRLQQLNQQQLKQPQQSNRQQQLHQQQLIQQQRQQPTTVNQHLNLQQQHRLQTSITSQLKQHQAQGLDRKKKPEKLPLPKVHSSPSRKTPKKTSRQSRSIKTTPYSSPQPNIQQLSLLQQQQIINSQFSQFYPLQNRAIVWQQQPPPSGLVSPSTVELQSIFQQVTAAPPQPFNRCHSVPAPPRTTTAQHPSFMPLTPQHRSGQQKGRRNLTNIFNNSAVVPQQQIVNDFAKLCGQLTSQQQHSFQQPPANNIIGFDLNDLSTPDELSDLVYPPFEHVDSEELINSLQTDAMR